VLFFVMTIPAATGAMPTNDGFANRSSLSGTNVVIVGSSASGTKEPGEPNHAGNGGGKSVWWSWTAPGSGVAHLSTTGSDFDTLLAVYAGNSLETLQAVASNNDLSQTQRTSRVSFNAVAGASYRIAIDGFNGASGNIRLELRLEADAFVPADFSRPDFWITDGQIDAVAVANGVAYVGGAFNFVGQNRGNGAVLDGETGRAEPDFPGANGEIRAVAADGKGGWFIGGIFTSVGGMLRTNLAHIREDKTVDPGWTPNPDAPVFALLLHNGVLYVGGQFLSVAGVSRLGIAALDPATGSATEWDPSPLFGPDLGAGQVQALAASGNLIYAGGYFDFIGGQSRIGLAAMDAATGQATDWNPIVLYEGTNWISSVSTLAVSSGIVYAAGLFDFIGGESRTNLAAVDALTGRATPWNPDPRVPDVPGNVFALVATCDTIFVGGDFHTIGGKERTNLAAISATTGEATDWNPDAPDFGGVFALALSGNTLYVGGPFFEAIGSEPRFGLGALDVQTGKVTAWAPNLSGQVYALAVDGRSVYAGGQTLVGGQRRRNLAAIDVVTGRVTDWNPSPNDWVLALAASGESLFVSGFFDSIGGAPRQGIAALGLATGQVKTNWIPEFSHQPMGYRGTIYTLAVSSNTVFAGGFFNNVNGTARTNLVALDATNGQVMPWAPDPDGEVNRLLVSGHTVYAVGSFTNIGGRSRPILAALDAQTGLAAEWNPRPTDTVFDLAVAGNTVYGAGGFREIGGQPRRFVAALDASTGDATPWNPNNDPTSGVAGGLAVVGETVYVAGGFLQSIGGEERGSLAGLDPSGQATAWNPNLAITTFFANKLIVSGRQFFVISGGVPHLNSSANQTPNLVVFPAQGSPSITQQPLPQTIPASQTLILSVAATGHQPLFYQWRKDGVTLVGETNAAIVIPSAGTNHSGVYTVLVTNALGASYSVDAPVTVFVPPSITVQPLSQTVVPGATVIFTVNASGFPPPQYQWRLNGANIPAANSSTLTLTSVQPADGGSYSVVVANVGGAMSSDTALLVVVSPALPFADVFDDRGFITGPHGLGSGSNVGATREPGETNHVGRFGSSSVWLQWQAPDDGIATFATRGSSFDTLLAVYTGVNVTTLTEVNSDDDRSGFFTSLAVFKAHASSNYVIAIDGFAGASGDIVLSWNLDTNVTEIPRIILQPLSQTVPHGGEATFSVFAASTTSLSYQWFFNDCLAIAGATNTTLTVTNVRASQVGAYTVEITSTDAQTVKSLPAFLEIGPDADTRSHDKLEDLRSSTEGAGLSSAPDFVLAAESASGASGFISVSMGTIASQILNNIGATTQQGETNHCGVIGGSSKWFGLTPVSDGTMQIDTVGSTLDTVLAVYRGTSVLTIKVVGCDDNGAPDRIRSLVRFAAKRGTNYSVAIDGVNGAQGAIQLNWKLGLPPTLVTLSSNQTVHQGDNLILRISANSPTPDLHYEWRLNNRSILWATNDSLALSNVQLTDAGVYSVVVRNFAGAVTNLVAAITVATPVLLGYELVRTNAGIRFRVSGAAGASFVLQATTDFLDWQSVHTNISVSAPIDFMESETPNYPLRFYRVIPNP